MKEIGKGKARRVAISLELEWPYKAHMEVFAGFQDYATAAGWVSVISPFADRTVTSGHACGRFDGVLARATLPLVKAARQARVPVVNVWMNSPAWQLPAVFPDYKAAGALGAKHLKDRGLRQLGITRLLTQRLFATPTRGVLRGA